MKKLWIHAGRHKTGSSAIQVSLHQQLDEPGFEYLDVGTANASSAINRAFRDQWFQASLKNRNRKAVEAARERARNLFATAAQNTQQANTILSAEAISLMEESEFSAMLDLLAGHFDQIALLAYFRPPKSDMESAFSERLKTGPARCEEPVVFKHRQRFAIFEKLLGESAVHCYRYAKSDFPGGDVVRHFCQEIGINNPPTSLNPVNTRLSLPAVRLLYLYRQYFPEKSSIDKALVGQLANLDGPPLRYHSSLFRQNFADPLDSFPWLEEKTGKSFREDLEADDATGIRSERDLLLPDEHMRSWLRTTLDDAAPDLLQRDPERLCRQLRDWVEHQD